MQTERIRRDRFSARDRVDRNAHRCGLRAFQFLPLFLLGRAGVIAGLEDRAVRQRTPSMNPTEWRDGP
jgi:hypothetical protein